MTQEGQWNATGVKCGIAGVCNHAIGDLTASNSCHATLPQHANTYRALCRHKPMHRVMTLHCVSNKHSAQQVEAAMKKWSTAYVYGMLGTDVATVGTVDMWLYRCGICFSHLLTSHLSIEPVHFDPILLMAAQQELASSSPVS